MAGSNSMFPETTSEHATRRDGCFDTLDRLAAFIASHYPGPQSLPPGSVPWRCGPFGSRNGQALRYEVLECEVGYLFLIRLMIPRCLETADPKGIWKTRALPAPDLTDCQGAAELFSPYVIPHSHIRWEPEEYCGCGVYTATITYDGREPTFE